MAVDMVAGAVKKILDAVVGGTFVEEEPLPAEAELARFLNVSRPVCSMWCTAVVHSCCRGSAGASCAT